jgi:hypothetical protein
MEEEAIFLFVVYYSEHIDTRMNKERTHEVREYKNSFKRAVLKREGASGEVEKHKRINIDFNPLDKNICYLVVAFFDHKEGALILSDKIGFVGIYDNEGEAAVVKNNVDNGEYKLYSQKHWEFKNSQIIPLVITKD